MMVGLPVKLSTISKLSALCLLDIIRTSIQMPVLAPKDAAFAYPKTTCEPLQTNCRIR